MQQANAMQNAQMAAMGPPTGAPAPAKNGQSRTSMIDIARMAGTVKEIQK